MSKENGSGKGPVHEVRFGRIKAAVWENSTENGVRHNVTISRIYKDGNQWKDSTSFGRDDAASFTAYSYTLSATGTLRINC